MPAFIIGGGLVSGVSGLRRRRVLMCEPQPPRDPGNLRSESSRRRNAPPKPLRRKKRRIQRAEEELDWAKMDSVPLVGARTPPESGEDYWIELTSGAPADSGSEDTRRKKKSKGVGKDMKERLRKEVVSPYTQNWILWAVAGVAVVVLLFKAFGGFDSIPVIPVPDL